jgi:hypothetical protein
MTYSSTSIGRAVLDVTAKPPVVTLRTDLLNGNPLPVGAPTVVISVRVMVVTGPIAGVKVEVTVMMSCAPCEALAGTLDLMTIQT